MVYDHFLRKVSYYWTLLDPVDPFGHPPVSVFGLELAACRSLVGLGIGV